MIYYKIEHQMGKIQKVHRILLAAAGGIALVAVGWLWLSARFEPLFPTFGIISIMLGLLLLSYVVFQIHEGLMALFWSGLFFLSGWVWSNIWEANLFTLGITIIPGAGLFVFGLLLLTKERPGGDIK